MLPAESVVKIKKDTKDKWATLKENGFPVKSATGHQSISVFQKSERTINETKFPGLEMWICSTIVLAEWRGERQIIPLTSFETLMPK